MKYFYKHPWYFAHIPKSGGTTFKSFFDRLFPQNQIFPHQLFWEIGHMTKNKNLKYQLFRGHFNALGPQLAYRPTRNITILRDPAAMALSSYRHILRDSNTKLHEKVAGEKWSFEDFIFSEDSRNLISNRMTNFLHLGHGVPIEDISYDLNPNNFGRIKRQAKEKQNRPNSELKFDIALDFLKQCFWIGVLEALPKSIDVLCMKAALPQVSAMPVLNRGNYMNQVSESSMEHLKQINKYDYQLLHYAQKRLDNEYETFFTLKKQVGKANIISHSYRKCHCQLFQKKPASQALFTMDQVIFGDQWYQREFNSETSRYFRWSGPETYAFIDFWLDKKNYDLSAIVSNHCLSDWSELSIDANQNELTYTVKKINTGWEISAQIPKEAVAKDGLLRLAFTVKATKIHSEVFDSDDQRMVGIALDQVIIK